jgi:hypothetical protein
MFRLFCGAALAISLCGCASFPTNYVANKEDVAGLTVYKPGTLFKQVNAAKEVWIKIPMLRVKGCPDGRLDFKYEQISWYLKTDWFGETTVRFRETTIQTVAASKRPHSILYLATDSSKDGCGLELASDASAIPIEASSEIKKWPRQLLDILVAERLPTTASSSWVDQFDFDETTRSINIMPGMRIRIHPELPFTADSSNAAESFHPGILAAPIYLELASAGPERPGMGQWSKSLEFLGFKRPDNAKVLVTPRTWRSASGLNDLDSQARFWRLFVPDRMSEPEVILPVEPCDTDDTDCLRTTLNDVLPPLIKGDGADKRKRDPQKSRSQLSSVPFVVETFFSDFDGYPGFTLAGSLNRTKLETMLRDMEGKIGPHGPNLTEACEQAGVSVSCFVFRYRAVIAPEIPVLVNREMVWIEPGTTVFNLLQRLSAGQLQGHFSSPLAGKANGLDRAGISDALMSVRRGQHWETASRDLTLMRRFEGGLVPVRAAGKSSMALLQVILQMGDEITWSR